MTKFGMIEKSGYTFFYGIEDIHHIFFNTAKDFFDDENDIFAYGFEPETNLIIIVFNDGITRHFDSAKYKIYFE